MYAIISRLLLSEIILMTHAAVLNIVAFAFGGFKVNVLCSRLRQLLIQTEKHTL